MLGLLAAALAPACSRRRSTGTSSALPPSSSGTIPPSMATPKKPFGPTVAGAFYPANPSTLDSMVRQLLADGSGGARGVPTDRRVFGIIAPHAGYVYSGPVAGWAYGALSPAVHTVFALGPNHRARAQRPCTLRADAYRTPIGDIAMPLELIDRLVDESGGLIEVKPNVFEPEHSLDVQMPFLLRALPNARVVPIIVPYMPKAQLTALAGILHKHIASDPGAALVASSDLSHFLAYETARRIDDQILSEIERNSVDSLIEHHDDRAGPCGVASIVVALDLLHRHAGAGVTRLRYQNSGDTAGDRGRVVGYGAIALTVPAA